VIKANFAPRVFFNNVLGRSLANAPWVELYISGFSCKPWSRLNHSLKHFKHPEAKVMWAVLDYIKKAKPPICILENVLGISGQLGKLKKLLQKASYNVVVLLTNPSDLGEPVQRPRYYILAVLQEVSIAPEHAVQVYIQAAWQKLKDSSRPVLLKDRTVPGNHSLVQQQLSQRKASNCKTSSCTRRVQSTKWKRKHTLFLEAKGRQSAGARLPSGKQLGLRTDREVDLWQALAATAPSGTTSLCCDTSQSIERCGARTDGTLPTITPGGRLVSSDLGREITPEEKLVLQAYPLHRMRFPLEAASPSQLSSMAGNGMHCMVLGAVILLTFSIVDWRKKETFRAISARHPAAAKPLKARRGTNALRKSQRSTKKVGHTKI
jgi:site-specific DNA-cytosine methylase